jgi:hypothetical protein
MTAGLCANRMNRDRPVAVPDYRVHASDMRRSGTDRQAGPELANGKSL